MIRRTILQVWFTVLIGAALVWATPASANPVGDKCKDIGGHCSDQDCIPTGDGVWDTNRATCIHYDYIYIYACVGSTSRTKCCVKPVTCGNCYLAASLAQCQNQQWIAGSSGYMEETSCITQVDGAGTCPDGTVGSAPDLH